MKKENIHTCNALIRGHPGGDRGDICGHGAGFVDLCCQVLARDGGPQ